MTTMRITNVGERKARQYQMLCSIPRSGKPSAHVLTERAPCENPRNTDSGETGEPPNKLRSSVVKLRDLFILDVN